ncbi:unnamed protein product [Rotaria socialis]|uniref:VCBS repeat-containing protein n=1 Tax=Rotaria socialis TaxID=392032 RepID=A0A820WKZ2_9BILA|nr:unnamed protein product [Rotaria socialis]CAF3344773.1 unnamed protein product [Rotaria socialis]CAF3564027.1 unnamed protein product [Rotaria socialis]CAF4519578.1 unnamed protein product [Rotaria socialis]
MTVPNHIVHTISIYLGQNDTTFSSPIQYPTGNGSTPYMTAVGDFNKDHAVDIAVTNFGTNSIVSANFNNDRYVDLAVANYGTDNFVIFFGNKNYTFANQITIPTGHGSRPHSTTVGSFTNDVNLDTAVANYGSNEIVVILNNGNGTFANRVNYSTGSASPYSIGDGDFNQGN